MDNRTFFNKIASEWDNMCSPNIEKLKKIIALTAVKRNAKILDVGTGTGVLVKYLLETSPAKIIGVDIAENMIEIAKQKYENECVEFVVSDILAFNRSGFDYIFLYSVYPHFTDKEALFVHLSQLMNRNGKIVIAHSESKEAINGRHAESKTVKDHVLPSAEITSALMSSYFTIDHMIDDHEMYYITGIKR